MLAVPKEKTKPYETALSDAYGSFSHGKLRKIQKEFFTAFFEIAPIGQNYFKQSLTRLRFIADKARWSSMLTYMIWPVSACATGVFTLTQTSPAYDCGCAGAILQLGDPPAAEEDGLDDVGPRTEACRRAFWMLIVSGSLSRQVSGSQRTCSRPSSPHASRSLGHVTSPGACLEVFRRFAKKKEAGDAFEWGVILVAMVLVRAIKATGFRWP